MKKNFFKFLPIGAFALLLGSGLAGCQDSPTLDEFNDVCERIKALENTVAELETTLVPGDDEYITDVRLDGNMLIFEYNGNHPDVEVELEEGGTAGFLVPGTNGNWFIDGEDTGIPMYGTPEILPNGNWGFPSFNGESYVVKDSGIPAGGEEGQQAWITGTSPDYTLWIYTKDNYSNPVQIDLSPSSSLPSGIAKIEILGWVTNYDVAAVGGLSRVAANEVKGELLADGEDFIVNYALISDFTFDTDATAATSATLAAAPGAGQHPPVVLTPTPKEWTGGAEDFLQGSVTNSLAEDRQGFLIQVYPANASLDQVKFQIQNTLGELLPIGFGTAEPVKVLLTRAVSDNALYFLPGDNFGNAEPFADGFASNAEFAMHFDDGALYQLTANGVVLSDLTDFSIKSQPMASAEAAVSGVQGTTEGSELVAANGSGDYEVLLDKWYTVDFNEGVAASGTPAPDATTGGTYTAGTAGVTDRVVDFYLEATGAIDPALFDIQFNTFTDATGEEHTQFMVKLLSDNITLVPFDMNVYKLGIDGKVYLETISILPVRNDIITVIPLGNYLITDVAPTGDNLSANMIVPFTRMFADLRANQFAPNVTLEQYWKDATRGAQTYQIKGISIGTTTTDVNGKATLTNNGFPFVPADATTWFTSVGTAGSTINGNTNENGTSGTALTNLTSAGKQMNQAGSFVMTVPITVADGSMADLGSGTYTADNINNDTKYPAADGNGQPDPTFLLNEEYAVTVDFIDAQGQVINTIIYTFTPMIPSPNALFTINPAFWTNPNDPDTRVLQAYYKDPVKPWVAGEAPNKEQYDIALLDYSNGAMTGPGGDGGFLSFVDGITWQITNTAIDGKTPVATYVTYTQNAAATPSDDMIFALQGQYLANVTETTIDLNGNGTVGDALTNVHADLVRRLDSANVALDAAPYNANAYGGLDYSDQHAGTVLTVAPTADYKYLGVYTYNPADLATAGFRMRIMSALFEGTVEPESASGITLTPAGGIAKLDDTQVHGHKYNSVVPYSLFQIWDTTAAAPDAVYEYTYIDKVEFYVPAQYSNDYSIVGVDGNTKTNVEIAPTATTGVDTKMLDGTAVKGGYINIKPTNTTNAVDAQIDIRVFDRFGKVKFETLNLHINAAVPAN